MYGRVIVLAALWKGSSLSRHAALIWFMRRFLFQEIIDRGGTPLLCTQPLYNHLNRQLSVRGVGQVSPV